MGTNSIPNVLGFLTSLVFLSACSTSTTSSVPSVEVRTIEVPPPAPIVPDVDQLRIRDVQWTIVTPENVDEVFQNMQANDTVLFALTSDGYEALSLNISDIRSNIEQYKKIVAIYESQYD